MEPEKEIFPVEVTDEMHNEQEPLVSELVAHRGSKSKRLIIVLSLVISLTVISLLAVYIYNSKSSGEGTAISSTDSTELETTETKLSIDEPSFAYRVVSDDDYETYKLPDQESTKVKAVSIVDDKAGIKLVDGSLVYENKIVTKSDNSYFLYGDTDLKRMVYWSGYNPTTVYDGENKYEIDGNFSGFRMVGDKISLLSDRASYFDGELFDTGQINLFEPEKQQEWIVGELADGSLCVSEKISNGLLNIECGGVKMLNDFFVTSEPFVYKGKLLFVATIFSSNVVASEITGDDIFFLDNNLDKKQVLVWGEEIISREYSSITDLTVKNNQYFFVGTDIDKQKVVADMQQYTEEERLIMQPRSVQKNNKQEVVHEGKVYGSEYESIMDAGMFNGHAVYIGTNSQDTTITQKDLVVDGKVVFSPENPDAQRFSLSFGHFAMVNDQPAFIVRDSVPDNYIQYGHSKLFQGTSALKKIYAADNRLHILSESDELLVEKKTE